MTQDSEFYGKFWPVSCYRTLVIMVLEHHCNQHTTLLFFFIFYYYYYFKLIIKLTFFVHYNRFIIFFSFPSFPLFYQILLSLDIKNRGSL